MPYGQIHHVNIISHSGSIMGIVIVSENAQLLKLPYRHLCDVGHQVVGNPVGILPYSAAPVSADGIKVPKQDHVPLLVRLLNIGKNLLQHGFGPSIRVGALTLGTFLRDGNESRVPVYRGAGGKDDVFHIMLSHHIYQSQRACNIVLIVLPGLAHGLSYGLQARKMDYCVDALPAKNFFQSLPVQDIRFIKGNLFTGYGLHPLQRLFA